jgi:hypothetical protein
MELAGQVGGLRTFLSLRRQWISVGAACPLGTVVEALTPHQMMCKAHPRGMDPRGRWHAGFQLSTAHTRAGIWACAMEIGTGMLQKNKAGNIQHIAFENP